PVPMYLAAAGVGHLVLADFDEVDLSNLQRQIVHTEARIGINKAVSAAATLRELNPATQITCVEQPLDAERLDELLKQVDDVLDGTDGDAGRFAMPSACVAARIPIVSCVAIGMEGQVEVYDLRGESSPRGRRLYEEGEVDSTCAANGVVAPLVGE